MYHLLEMELSYKLTLMRQYLFRTLQLSQMLLKYQLNGSQELTMAVPLFLIAASGGMKEQTHL